MSNINTAVQLYEMMAQRFEKTGWTPAQAAVYREMATFMKNECATLEEATAKIRNSHLFDAPAVALMKDKIHAYIRAAKDDEIEGVEEVYRQKLAEIDRNPASIHDPAFFTTAHNIYIKYLGRLNAFINIYGNYLCGVESDFKADNMNDAFKDLERYGGDFAQCAKRPEFRELVPISDEAYNNFVKNALFYHSNPPDDTKLWNEIKKQVDDVYDNVVAVCDERLRTWKEKCGACLITAPPDQNGDYKYTEIIVSDAYED